MPSDSWGRGGREARARGGRDARSSRIVAGAIGALVVLTVAAVAFASWRASATGDAPVASAGGRASLPAPASHVSTPPPEATSTAPAAPAVAPAAAPVAPAHVPAPAVRVATTIPDRMASLPAGSTQIIVITGAALGANTGTLRIFDKDGGRWTEVLTTPANFGKTGLVDGRTRQSGHLNTPTGIWWIGGFLFGQHASAPPGTKMPYRPITATSWWSSRPDATYNTWVESASHVAGEHLQDSTVQYEYAFDTGYNAPPNERVIGRGSAIFIHCFEPPGNSLGQFTHGCIAIAPDAMLRMFALLDPARRPTCVIGTEQAGSATSVYAY
jgi:L,D-peptidoglycan transpeptidase YkuD (ErfK/YbiS/YcfS/YnhG family)